MKGLAALVALAPVASAFFIWVPPGKTCPEGMTCSSSKREVESRDIPEALQSLQVIQRLPRNDLPQNLRVKRLAERLREKYSRIPTKVQSEDVDGNGLKKRTNDYTIMTATTPTQTDSAGIDQDGTDYSYFAQVYLGSAKTPMYMLLDTGAGTSWVMGPSCTSDSCKLHNSFGAANSTTFVASTNTFSVSYGSGSVSGTLATDSLTLAGLTVTMTLGIANNTSADFTSFPMDGILGLSQAQGSTPNFLQTLVSSKQLKSNLFAVDLNRASDGTNNGEISFGAVDTSKFEGTLNYNAVATSADGEWAISMDNAGVGGDLAGITGRLAYIDTGTSYIFGPPEDVLKFHAVVSGATSSDNVTWSVPCTTTKTMDIVFGGVSYSILASDWVGDTDDDGMCTSNIFGHAVVDGAWLLGDTFLKNVYSVFDVDENRIGFVQKISTSTTSTSKTSGPSSTHSAGATVEATATISPGISGHESAHASGTTATATATSTSAVAPMQDSSAMRLPTSLLAALVSTLAFTVL